MYRVINDAPSEMFRAHGVDRIPRVPRGSRDFYHPRR